MMENPPELWVHQREALARAKFTPGFFFGFDPGCGKSRTLIEIVIEKSEQDLRFSQTGKFHNTLIVCPKAVIETWGREWVRFSTVPKERIALITGPGFKKKKAIDEVGYYINSGEKRSFIVVTNPETLLNNQIFQFLKAFTKILVLDESQKFKDGKAQRTRKAVEIADKCVYRYLLSGTPILNSQMDIFSQFRILDGGKTFGKNIFAFRAKYFFDKNEKWKGFNNYFPKWIPKANTNERIRELIRPLFMTVKKEECLDLPPMVKQEIFVELTPQQRVTYNEMKKDLITFLNDKACVAQMALTKCIRLQQMVSGFMKFDDDSEHTFDAFEKLFALKELLEDLAPNHKTIVWCIYKKNYLDIGRVCKELKLEYAELHGEIINKDEEIQRFQNEEKCRVMIASPAAGSLGISLTSASYSIFYSRSFSLEHDIQAEARNYRGGSLEAGHTKITRIDLICKDSIDEIIMEALKTKTVIADDIIGMLRKRL